MWGLKSAIILLAASHASGFIPTAPSAVGNTPRALLATSRAAATDSEENPIRTADVVSKVAVTGATGRTGSLVVKELLSRGVDVVALVRDMEKATEKLPLTDPVNGNGDFARGNLEVVKCNLGDEQNIALAVAGCDASIWCATGFSDAPGIPFFDKLMRIIGIVFTPKQSIDAVGLPTLGKIFASAENDGYPKVVMLSSAGVTRPSWSDEKKELFHGSADIPIVRLNPFGILDVKAESEEKLRQSGADYCIVRPAGLNDKWPSGSRPVLTQGDVAVGRISREDVATILVDCLSSSEATGKTFETITLAGYQPAVSMNRALSRMKLDKDGLPSDEALFATYSVMQQLLPGERQDAAALAMGQTYEQLDKDEVGRFGKRGQEDVEASTLKPST